MKINILSFEDAHKIVLDDAKRNNICGYNDWQKKYIVSDFFPKGIPKQPQITYKNRGWNSWGHWLGTSNISNAQKSKFFLKYEDAKKWIEKYKISSRKMWYKYISTRSIPSFIPTNPQRTYKNDGWNSWGHWFGTGNARGGFSCRKYDVNHNFFNSWSPDMAYILGFWWADGCMKGTRKFNITQHKRDRYLIENILETMNSNYPIYNDRNCSYIEISSKKICDNIISLGGMRKKSLVILMPEVPDKYLGDFVRGYFDGDGCITFDKNCKKHMSYITSGSEKFLIQMQKRLSIFGIYCHKNNQISLKFNADNTIKLGNLMYYDGMNIKLLLKRKYEKFLSIN